MNHVRFQINRQLIEGKTIVGIDPAKEFHHAAVVDAHGTQVGNSFSFPVSATGYHEILSQPSRTDHSSTFTRRACLRH